MGNCLKTKVQMYRKRNWENALLDIKSVDNYFSKDESCEAMKDFKGSGGFPFKTNKGRFIKVIMKNKRNIHFRVMMNLKALQKNCNNETYLLLPDKYVETEYAIHFHYPYCKLDMIHYLNNTKIKPNDRNKIMMHLLDAVEYMHDKGYVHKDIKLDNILFRNGQPVLCDCDFSLRDNVYSFKGTRDYMASQAVIQCLFDKRKDLSMSLKNKWMDCYALGKTFAKILSVKKSKDIETTHLWDKWTNIAQVSIRSFTIDEENFILKSKWWNVVFWFCKYNEEYVFSKRNEYFWSIKKVKHFI